MRFTLLSASALAFSTLLSAQGPTPDRFEIFPSRGSTDVTFVSRMTFGTLAGEALQEYPANLMRGVGRDAGPNCEFSALYFQTQDQNQATQETYQIVLRSESATPPGPDATPAGVIFNSGNLMLPPSTGTGAAAYIITQSFSTPIQIPCEATFFLGFSFTAAPLWATDGQSISCAGYRYPAPFAAPSNLDVYRGDYPRLDGTPTGSLNHSWQIYTTAASVQVVGRTASGRTQRQGLLHTGAQLNMGNVVARFSATTAGATPRAVNHTSYGFGGMYPEINTTNPYVRPMNAPPAVVSEPYQRHDGLSARLLDTQSTGGVGALFLSTGLSPVPGGLAIPGFSGMLWINPAVLISIAQGPIALVGTEGILEMPLVPEGVLSSGMIGFSLAFQGVTVNSTTTTARLTNAMVTTF